MSKQNFEIYHPGVEVESNGRILTLSEKARIAWSDTARETITLDATALSESAVLEFLNVAENAFDSISTNSGHDIDLVIDCSTHDSATLFRAILKTQVSPLLKIILAMSGTLAVKHFGLDSALELLNAKVRDCLDGEHNHRGSLTVGYPEPYLFLFPGMSLEKQVSLASQTSARKAVEDVFETEDILQIVSFVAEKDSSITLGEYLSSHQKKLEPPSHKFDGASLQTLSKLSKISKKSIVSLTSNQLKELISLVSLCDLDSYPIETLIARMGLPRVANGYHAESIQKYTRISHTPPKVCTEHLVPAFTLDEMNILKSEARDLYFDAKIFSTHLHSPVDFLLAEVAVRKGISRYVELCGFIRTVLGPVSVWTENQPSQSFNKERDRYFMEITMEALKDANDDVPIVWLAEIHQPQLTD